MTAQSLKDVNIILEESGHARNFAREKLIHEYEYDQAIRFIDSLIPEENHKKADKYLHNTITIFGTRGSGKTSFLLSLKEAYAKHSKLKVLRIIDPTLIEEKGHVFLNVIASIREDVLDAFEEMKPEESIRESKRKWRESMMKLAAGLPSIDGMSKQNHDDWQDPEYVLDKGLVSVESALNLGKYFDEFLRLSLEILGKTSFLLIFDDIDVDATKGWAVLETIRKYFTTSRLITVLSGDLKLYSLVIRQKKWSNFGSEILEYEGQHLKKLPYFNGMVTELESQYLQKIMQPRYRIHLLSLQEKKQINRIPKILIKKSLDQSEAGIEIQELYSKILSQFGIRNIGQAEVFKTFILSQPFRTQIQFASVMAGFLIDEANIASDQNNEKITDIFLADLLEQEIDVNLINSTAKFLNSITLELLLRKGQLRDLYQLQPSTIDNSLNACLTSLNLLLSKSFTENNLFISFDYLIKIGYIRNLGVNLSETDLGSNLPSLSDLCRKTGVFNDGVLRDTIGKINAYLMGAVRFQNGRNDFAAAYINLLGLNGPAKRISEDRLDFVFKNDGSVTSILGTLPSYSASYSFKNNSTVAYSIYMVIGAIGELVRVYESNDSENLVLNREDRIKSVLSELSQHRQYPVPDFRSGNASSNIADDRDTIDELRDGENESTLAVPISKIDFKFIELLIDWLERKPTHSITPHVLGKISTRFYTALENMFRRRPSSMLLGDFFHFQIMAFMNAVLIEDVRENFADSSHLNINNINFSERLLIINLQNTLESINSTKKTANTAYSQWLLSCPILQAYIRHEREDGLHSLLNTYCKTSVLDDVYSALNIAEKLDQIAIDGNPLKSSITRSSTINFSRLSEEGNEKQLIDRMLKRHGNLLPLIQSDNLGEMARRNKTLKKVLPTLFPDDISYSNNAKKLRARLKEKGFIK